MMKVSSNQDNLPGRPIIQNLDNNNVTNFEKIKLVQDYIECFEYNYSGKPFLQLKKSWGASQLLSATKELIRISLPIQCVEAVFIASVLTRNMTYVDRIPISFKSIFGGTIHRHIVMAVRCEDGMWGSIGISRRENLMFKFPQYNSLMDLIHDFEVSYQACFHTLVTVYIGLCLPRIYESDRPIKWRALKLRLRSTDREILRSKVDNFCIHMNQWTEDYNSTGELMMEELE